MEECRLVTAGGARLEPSLRAGKWGASRSIAAVIRRRRAPAPCRRCMVAAGGPYEAPVEWTPSRADWLAAEAHHPAELNRIGEPATPEECRDAG